MLKERKILNTIESGSIGCFTIEGYVDDLEVQIMDHPEKKYVSEEYYFTEFKASASESDYHTFYQTYHFEGVLLDFNLNDLDTAKYFGEDLTDTLIDKKELLKGVLEILERYELIQKLHSDYDICIKKQGYLQVVLLNKKLSETVLKAATEILLYIREYYDQLGIHITRMFGSYILLKKVDGELKAIRATPIPIQYCPLMVKLLKEVGGECADALLETLKTEDEHLQTERMCNLINEVVIQGGYFDTNRPLNSCEANVLFGASETISSAFKSNLIDASVIVSNNLGTIITTNEFNTQGSVKRMTGLFYTSPSEKLVKTAVDSGIIPVFPYTATIDQVEGVKKAIQLGYKRIAVSVAAGDNYLLQELKELEKDGVILYKFGLCSTGIDKETAIIMKENADVVWSCASKYVKEMIEPSSIAQVGIKIPVHVMTERGWEIIRNHLSYMNFEDANIEIHYGEDPPVILNEKGKMKVLRKSEVHKCTDCPHPCV